MPAPISRNEEQADKVSVINTTLQTSLVTSADVAILTDPTENAIVMVSSNHYHVHVGGTFRFWYLVPHGSELANDASFDIAVTTAAKAPHISFLVTGGGNFEVRIFRDPTISAAGEGLTVHPLNDNEPQVSTVIARLNPTVTDDGTEIEAIFAPGGVGNKAGGGAVNPDTLDVWKTNRVYLIRITNRSGSAHQFSINAEWYEE